MIAKAEFNENKILKKILSTFNAQQSTFND